VRPDSGRPRAGQAFFPAASFGLALFLGIGSRAAADPADVRAVVALRINGTEARAAVVVLRGPDVLVPVADLKAAGLRRVEASGETVAGEPHVSLLSLAPEVRFSLDEKELVLRLEVPPSWFGEAVIDVDGGPPEGILYSSNSSAFANYSARWSRSEGFSGFAEAGWSMRGNLLYGSALRKPDGTFVRGLTHFDVDDRPRLRRWTLGDVFAETGELGGGSFMGGVGFSRNFDLNPYFIRFPRFGFSGAVSTPSTADIYVNGALVRREEIPAGQFDLRNIPAVSGTGSVRIVLRDVFGQERAIVSPYYFSTGLLAAGLSDYSYNLGVTRANIGNKSADYGQPLLLARHRIGLTGSVTAGGRLEVARDLVSGGPSLALRLALGELDFAASGSSQNGKSGGAASLGYTYVGSRWSVGTSLRALSNGYANASLTAAMDRANLEGTLVAGTQVLGGLSLSTQYSASRFRDKGRRDAASLSASMRVARPATLLVSAGRSREEGKGWTTQVFAGLTFWLGKGSTGSLSLDSRGGTVVSTAELERPLPRGEGLGYRFLARGNRGEGSDGLALLQYQGPFGRYEASYERVGQEGNASINASGGLVAIGGSVYGTRPVDQGFALVRLPGVSNVRAFLSNQEVGRTGASGDLLVPDLLPYYGNRLSISDKDVPMEYAIDATERIVAPPYRGGALISFPVRKIRTVSGVVVIERDGKETVPSFGQITVALEGGSASSPIARGGEFFLENVSPGERPATIESQEGTCRFLLRVPDSPEPFIQLGKIVCSSR